MFPVARKSRQLSQLGQLRDRTAPFVDQAIESGDRPLRIWPIEEGDRCACFDQARIEDAQVPAAQAGANHGPDHMRVAKAKRQLEARPTRLRHLHGGASDLENISDGDAILIKSLGGEVFTEATRREQRCVLRRERSPARVMLARVAIEGLIATAMHAPVRLLIAGEA